jgi:hypothetical protein
MQREHETAANHVAKLAIWLAPVPGFAEKFRKLAATGGGVLGDELANKIGVSVGHLAAAVLELHFFHGGEA